METQTQVQLALALAEVAGQGVWAWAGVLEWRGHTRLYSGSAAAGPQQALLWAAEQGVALLRRPSCVRVLVAHRPEDGAPGVLQGHVLEWADGGASPLLGTAQEEVRAAADYLGPAWRILQAPPAPVAPPAQGQHSVGMGWLFPAA